MSPELPIQFTPLEDGVRRLLGGGMPTVDHTHRVFANTDLAMSSIKMVGFDMDYTLAIYNKGPMEQLQYDLTVKRLVEHMGYPTEIQDLVYDPTFIVRGLTVDKRTGTLFKMDSQGQVTRCFRGKDLVPPEEYVPFYRNASSRISSEDFASLDTLFAMPEACLYANLVEHFTKKHSRGENVDPLALAHGHETANLGSINTWKLFHDVRKSIDDIHRDGSLKSIIMADLSRYIVVDEGLPLTLHKLRSSGKRLFLLTNSYWQYTNAVMSYLLNEHLREYPSWRGYFDIVIVGGRKPGFFAEREPFLEVDQLSDSPRIHGEVSSGVFDKTKVYQHGNMETFEQMCGAYGPEILYVGDHIFGDILRSKKDSGWRTCHIVEELEDEIRCVLEGKDTAARLAVIDEQRHNTADAIGEHRAVLSLLDLALTEAPMRKLSDEEVKGLETAHRRLKKEIDVAKRALRKLDDDVHALQDEIDMTFNPYWGRLLKTRNELSRFGSQIRSYADTYTSRVSNFLQYSPMHLYRAPRDLMTHDYVLADSRGLTNVRRPEEPGDLNP